MKTAVLLVIGLCLPGAGSAADQPAPSPDIEQVYVAASVSKAGVRVAHAATLLTVGDESVQRISVESHPFSLKYTVARAEGNQLRLTYEIYQGEDSLVHAVLTFKPPEERSASLDTGGYHWDFRVIRVTREWFERKKRGRAD